MTQQDALDLRGLLLQVVDKLDVMFQTSGFPVSAIATPSRKAPKKPHFDAEKVAMELLLETVGPNILKFLNR